MIKARPLPRNVQISESLIREISAGVLANGARLPTEKQMAKGYGVSVGTLRKSLATLEKKVFWSAYRAPEIIYARNKTYPVFIIFFA